MSFSFSLVFATYYGDKNVLSFECGIFIHRRDNLFTFLIHTPSAKAVVKLRDEFFCLVAVDKHGFVLAGNGVYKCGRFAADGKSDNDICPAIVSDVSIVNSPFPSVNYLRHRGTVIRELVVDLPPEAHSKELSR